MKVELCSHCGKLLTRSEDIPLVHQCLCGREVYERMWVYIAKEDRYVSIYEMPHGCDFNAYPIN